MFNFGLNWKNYSRNSLNEERFKLAKESLRGLLDGFDIKGKTFLDIGCGSGIFSLAAKELGAKEVAGFDVLKDSIEASQENKKRFMPNEEVNFYQQSVIKEGFDKQGKFDVVYSWGVLHHTGDMYKAIFNSMKLVKDNGIFILALYNKHWSSFLWKKIKWFYNISPKLVQTIMIDFFYGVIALAKFMVTWENPFAKKRRGMDFYHDVVDWVGGYPYEYATGREIKSFFEKNGFKLVKYEKAKVPTGCNEFIFKK